MLTPRTGMTALLLSFTALPALAADHGAESTAG